MIEHTPGPWKYLTPRSGLKRTQDIAIFALNGQQVANVHSGAMPTQRRPDHKEAEGNADLIMKAREAPHECSDPDCPGNVNRRKLEAFAGLLAACERAKGLYDYLALGPFGAAAKYGPDHDYERISDEECLATRGALEAAIAKAKE